MTVAGWTIAALTIVAVLVRPFRVNEAWWATAGALLLLLTGSIAPRETLAALASGGDVYLFLIGMMALAEIGRGGGLFDWIAARAIATSRGSRFRLLAIVYGIGIVTTALLSNDATIVLLTPAVIAALRRVDAPPAAYVIACALVANAASFVLPISNPSNLLVFAGRMPSLGTWLAAFGLASLAAVTITFAVLAAWFRRDLRGNDVVRDADTAVVPLERTHLVVVAASAIVIVITSARSGPLGLTACACALAGCIAVAARQPAAAITIGRNIAWPVVIFTAALFVIVAAVERGGGAAAVEHMLAWCAAAGMPGSKLAAGFAVAAASNVVNNLPVGLLLGQTLPTLHAASHLADAVLVGVNLGPNATVNGSLATLLWLGIVRRAGIAVTPLGFAAAGIAATVPALVAALVLVR